MTIEPATEILTSFCQTFPCNLDFDDHTAREFAAQLEWVNLPQGAVLFNQGDVGDSLYAIQSGALEVILIDPQGHEQRIDVLDSGESVGEIALLTGQKRSATIRALTDSILIRLSKSGLEKISTLDSNLSQQLINQLLPRIQRTQLAMAVTRLFGPMEARALHEMQRKAIWRHLLAGETLIQQGDVEDTMYLVINGRLVMESSENGNSPRILGEVERGESVGEFAMISPQPRSATIVAMRDSDVVEISREVFEKLSKEHPNFLHAMTRQIVQRSRRIAGQAATNGRTVTSIAVQPLNRGVPLAETVRQLVEQLSAFGPTLHFDSQKFDDLYGKPGAARTRPDDPLNYSITNWLNEQEERFTFVVYQLDSDATPWTERGIRQADRLLIVGDGSQRPDDLASFPPSGSANRHSLRELVLVQPASQAFPQSTAAWLTQDGYRAVHHIRLGNTTDFSRLARRVTGRSTGIVFSGGGARGFAHVGAVRALEEMKIPVDLIGGTSMGALIGGAWAAGMAYEDIVNICRTFASPRQILDYTFPISALTRSKKVTRIFQQAFGELKLENLWTPFFCVSTNMTRSEPYIHRQGDLWLAVRASTAIPGIFAPVVVDGDVLVDGGVMNPFPADIMRADCQGGTVIGVNCSPKRNKFTDYDFSTSISGWEVLLKKLLPIGRKHRVPSIMTNLMGAAEVNGIYHRTQMEEHADLVLTPPVTQFDSLDFGAYDQLIEIGYQYTLEKLREAQPV